MKSFLRFWENQSAIRTSFSHETKNKGTLCLDHHHHHCVIYAACCRLEELRAVHRPKMKKSNPNMHRHIFTMGPKMKILSIYRRSSPFYYAYFYPLWPFSIPDLDKFWERNPFLENWKRSRVNFAINLEVF